MEARSPGQLMRGFFEEVWNKRASDQIAHFMAPDVVTYAVDETGANVVGHEGFRVFFQRFMDSFSEVQFTVHEVLESGSMAAGRWSCRLTHTGHGLGVPPTGKTVTLSGMSFLRASDGYISEGWNEWDRAALGTALGLLVPAK